MKNLIFIGILVTCFNGKVNGQDCYNNRFLLKETRNYFHFSPAFRLGDDSLRILIRQKLNDKLLMCATVKYDTIQIFLEINSKGSLTKIEPFLEEEYVNTFKEALEFLFSIKNMWCPGYYYIKTSKQKELNKIGNISLLIYIENGKFKDVIILH